MPEHSLGYSYGRPEICYLKGGHDPASTRQFHHIQTVWGSMITHARFSWSMRIHDHSSMEGVGEGSRRKEQLPIKPRKKIEEGEKKGGKFCHFDFRIQLCKNLPKYSSFTQQLLSCTNIRSNVFPKTPHIDLSIRGFSPEKPLAPLSVFVSAGYKDGRRSIKVTGLA